MLRKVKYLTTIIEITIFSIGKLIQILTELLNQKIDTQTR